MEETTKKNGVLQFIMKKGVKQALKILVPCILVGAICFGIGSKLKTDENPTKFGLEDIGELATQAAYVTEVSNVKDPRTVFGLKVPFTESHLIFSYDFVIKAGFEVDDIIPEVNEEMKTVKIKMPKAKVLSNEQKLDSFEVYLEDESVFSQVKLGENNEAVKKLKKDAEKTAIENGLLEGAEENAKTVLTGLFANQFDPKEYTYEFEFK